MPDYVTVDNLRDYIGSDTTNFAAVAQSACTVASRWVEAKAGRTFFGDSTVSARYFDPISAWECNVDDISTTSGLIVATDDGGNGTYSGTWTYNTDFILEPVNSRQGGIAGYPFTKVKVLGNQSRGFFINRVWSMRPFVKVTAKWGWAAVPDDVTQAALMKAAEVFKMKDAANGTIGLDGWGPVRFRENPAILALLGPYMLHPYATA